MVQDLYVWGGLDVRQHVWLLLLDCDKGAILLQSNTNVQSDTESVIVN